MAEYNFEINPKASRLSLVPNIRFWFARLIDLPSTVSLAENAWGSLKITDMTDLEAETASRGILLYRDPSKWDNGDSSISYYDGIRAMSAIQQVESEARLESSAGLSRSKNIELIGKRKVPPGIRLPKPTITSFAGNLEGVCLSTSDELVDFYAVTGEAKPIEKSHSLEIGSTALRMRQEVLETILPELEAANGLTDQNFAPILAMTIKPL